jgi:aspartyl-tRNA(Asn)/glutamyl-tRNA(Gln) amidotransferase subunit A
MEPKFLHARYLAGSVRSGVMPAEEVVRDTLAAIDLRDPEIHAFLHVDREGALEAARHIDRRVALGKDPGPLAGVPIAVKDNICTKDLVTTAASRILEGHTPSYDATVINRIRDAGGIIIGKTNLDEFAMGSSTEHSAYGSTKNPHDLTRVPGGSSGGSAAALAADMVCLALGSDTGGSVRQPASLSGIVGLKPTYGRVSRYGLIAFASSLDHIGPMGRSVEDVALLLDVIAGKDPADSTSSSERTGPYLQSMNGGVKGMRIGIPPEYLHAVDPEVSTRIREATNVLRRSGAEIRPVNLRMTPYANACYYVICTAEASSNLARYDGTIYGRTRETGFGPEVTLRVMLGTFVLSAGFHDAYYLNAARVRTLIRKDFEDAFTSVDALIGPASPTTAFRLGERLDEPLKMYKPDILTVAANLAGIPAISVPCGLAENLPVGLQVMAPPFHEGDLLRIARVVEEAQ